MRVQVLYVLGKQLSSHSIRGSGYLWWALLRRRRALIRVVIQGAWYRLRDLMALLRLCPSCSAQLLTIVYRGLHIVSGSIRLPFPRGHRYRWLHTSPRNVVVVYKTSRLQYEMQRNSALSEDQLIEKVGVLCVLRGRGLRSLFLPSYPGEVRMPGLSCSSGTRPTSRAFRRLPLLSGEGCGSGAW